MTDYFLQRFCRQIGKKLKGVDTSALKAMQRYPWPGNVRELQNVMERAVILAQGMIRPENLPEALLAAPEPDSLDSRDLLKSVERDMIIKTLARNRANRRLTADELGISRRTLQYKLKEYGLLGE